jgi:hypothetical protein
MADDPLGRVKVVLAYVVAAVWTVSFASLLIAPARQDSTGLLLVNGAMMAVLGGLWAENIRRRNGGPR